MARLRLVPDQPVEGCELCPDVFLVNGVPQSTARLEYHWYRSTEKMACSWCGKTPVTMQRLTDNAYYCSVNCFFAAWPGHAAQHRTGLTQRGPRTDAAAPIEGWNCLDNQAEQQSEQKWVEVCDQQSYTPTADDVGHMLKLVRCRGRGGGGGKGTNQLHACGDGVHMQSNCSLRPNLSPALPPSTRRACHSARMAQSVALRRR